MPAAATATVAVLGCGGLCSRRLTAVSAFGRQRRRPEARVVAAGGVEGSSGGRSWSWRDPPWQCRSRRRRCALPPAVVRSERTAWPLQGGDDGSGIGGGSDGEDKGSIAESKGSGFVGDDDDGADSDSYEEAGSDGEGGGADVRAAAGEVAPQTLPLLEKRVISGEKVLQISKADFTVSSVLDKIKRGKLDLRPSYQRDFVWDKKTASKLIESLLLNIPVPTMFFHEREKGILEVVDGKQRLTSIWSYIVEARFPDGTEFSLTGLEVLHKLNGLKYCDLDESSKEAMQDFALNVHTISRHSDDDVVFEVFERLNMGSTQLNEQELRNCIFQGSYNDLLEELVKNTHMQQALRLDAPHKRMRDRELILRFFALRRGGIEGFFTPNKAWLNAEIRRYQFLDSEEARAMAADFAYCIRTAVEVFGKRAFRRPQ